MNCTYDGKFKACSPRETVDRILGILNRLGIETEEKWTDSGVNGICSVRVTIRGTDIGQNGKGTDRDFARASGYAEFMERLQTGYLLPEQVSSAPGRIWLTREEVKAGGGKLLDHTLRRIRSDDGGFAFLPLEPDSCLDQWSFDDRDGLTPCIPFTRLSDGAVEVLPENILRAYYFTNGSCAGNSREEAFVQGLSEICERFAMTRILRERLTPPLIPDETFAGFELLKNTVGSIRGSGRYDLRLMDASCGMGLPVLCSALTDRETGRMIVRFGAHPRFEIALERCLTETLQGRHLEKLEAVPVYSFKNSADCNGFINCFNLIKAGAGTFTSEIFLDQPSWEYAGFEPAPAGQNGQLSCLLSLYEKLGWEIYVRDCSFTGFPVYQLLIPSESVIFAFGSKKLTEKRWLSSFRRKLPDLERLSDDDLREIRKLALLKRAFILENTFPQMSGLPVTPEFLGIPVNADILAALCSMALGEQEESAGLLSPYCFDGNGKMTKIYPLVQLLLGSDSEKAYSVMKNICREGMAEEARKFLRDPRSALAGIREAAGKNEYPPSLINAMRICS